MLFCVGTVPSPRAWAGDAELAKFLLDHGRKALDKGDEEDALTKLEKARVEDPTLHEATYWIGATHEKLDNRARAVEEYRTYVEALESEANARKLSRDESSLLKKARSRLDTLDAANRAVEKSNLAFIDKLIDFAAGAKKKDPELAIRALRIALDLVPGHADAANALSELQGPTSTGSPVLEGFDDTWDLIKSVGFGVNDGWTYDKGDPKLTISKGVPGSLSRSLNRFDSGSQFGFEADVSFLKQARTDKTPVCGIGFGFRTSTGFMLLLIPDALSLEEAQERGFKPLARTKVAAWAPGDRRLVGIRVEGRRVRIFLNGEQVLEHTLEEEPGGDLGMFYENIDYRLDRLMFARPGKGGGK